MDPKTRIIKALSKITGLPVSEIHLDVPEREEFGDYSSNISMTMITKLQDPNYELQKNLKLQFSNLKSPRELAEKIASAINNQKSIINYLNRVEVAGPGFINFHLSKEVLFDTFFNIKEQKDTFGKNTSKKGKKIVVEFTDPNPFKEFHVGHLYSNTVGESISRLIEAQADRVWRADYFGDVGMHVAKAIWGLLQKFDKEGMSMSSLKGRTLNERIEYLGQAYALGATEYEEGQEESKEDMKALNFLVFKAAQEVVLPEFKEKPQVDYDQYINKSKYKYEEIKNIYKVGRSWSLDYFESIYKRLGMGFDGYYPESRTGEFGYGMVLDGLTKGIFEKGEKGAVIFPGEKYGLHNRVFINSMSLPTYEAKDFGNAVVKFKDFPYDKSVIVTGNEINEYFVVVLKALEMYESKLSKATKHIGHGMVRLPEGKMSSRTGKIIRGEWVLDEAKKRALAIIEKSDSFKESSKLQKEETAEAVAQGAIKYAFLKQGIGNNIAFDFDSSLSFEGNSGPYIQYTYARTQSVLSKSRAQGPTLTVQKMSENAVKGPTLKSDMELNLEEMTLLRSLNHFPEVVEEAATNFAPNLLCTYLYTLAQKFNTFYNKHSILGSKTSDVSPRTSAEEKTDTRQPISESSRQTRDFRLTLTSSVGQVLMNGLKLLGIGAPTKM